MRFRLPNPRLAIILAAAAALTSCPYNQSLKDDLEFARSIVPAHSWDEIRTRTSLTPPGGACVIGVTGSFDAKNVNTGYSPTIEIKENKKITLVSAGGEVKIRRIGMDELFAVTDGGVLIMGDRRSGGTLVFDGNKGTILSSKAFVQIGEGGACVMNQGAVLRNNAAETVNLTLTTSGWTASFTMNGGTISGNNALNGGGVFANAPFPGSIVFTMNGGVISDNSAELGGGVYLAEAGFTMKDGIIAHNKAAYSGGGVCVIGSEFSMKGGTIAGNKALGASSTTGGGGVYADNASSFIKTGGTIFGKNEGGNSNTAANPSPNSGQAVHVANSPPKYRDTTAGPQTGLDSANNINWND